MMNASETKSTGPETMTTVRLNGRDYTVETVAHDDCGRARYVLTGKRGARYFTMRNVPNPDFLFIYGESLGSSLFRGQWFTDASGSLQQVR